jgi:hypothetical protein
VKSVNIPAAPGAATPGAAHRGYGFVQYHSVVRAAFDSLSMGHSHTLCTSLLAGSMLFGALSIAASGYLGAGVRKVRARTVPGHRHAVRQGREGAVQPSGQP